MARTTAGERVCRLLKEHWNGNQSEMARDTKCAQSTLSLVASGKKEPGKRLLTLIAAHPGLNADWVFHGKGKPFSTTSSLAKAKSLPIAERVLQGSPEEFPNSVLDERQDVVPHLANPGAYFLRVQGDEPIVYDVEMGVRAGDLLLIDTASSAFPKIERLFRKLCVVRLADSPEKFCLGLVSYVEASEEDGVERVEVDTFDLGIQPDNLVRKKHTVKVRGQKRVVVQLYRRTGDDRETKLVPVSDLELEPPPRQIEYKDIVGVCKMLIRKRF